MDSKYFKDVNTIVHNINSYEKGTDWPVGVDYGCALARYHGVRKERYKERVIEAFKQIFADDPERLKIEISDLEDYSEK